MRIHRGADLTIQVKKDQEPSGVRSLPGGLRQNRPLHAWRRGCCRVLGGRAAAALASSPCDPDRASARAKPPRSQSVLGIIPHPNKPTLDRQNAPFVRRCSCVSERVVHTPAPVHGLGDDETALEWPGGSQPEARQPSKSDGEAQEGRATVPRDSSGFGHRGNNGRHLPHGTARTCSRRRHHPRWISPQGPRQWIFFS